MPNNTTNVPFSVTYSRAGKFWTFTFPLLTDISPIYINNDGLEVQRVVYNDLNSRYAQFGDEMADNFIYFIVDYTLCTSPVGASLYTWIDNVLALAN
jgi:hypothetical protein